MIGGRFTVTEIAEAKALIALGADPASAAWRVVVTSGRDFHTVKTHGKWGNDMVSASDLRVVGFRVRKGVAQFDAKFDNGHEWVTADSAWRMTFERVL